MKKSILYIFWIYFFHLSLYAQDAPNATDAFYGKIKQYTRTDFNADPQFWAMCEDKDGVIFFGNNDGVIIFDGEHWQKINLPNNSSVRSLHTTPQNIIYAGGYNEIGTIQKDSNGRYFYKSLIEDLQLEGKNIENIWQIHSLNGKVLCRAFNELIIISGKTATHIPASNSFIYSNLVGNNYYVEDSNHGILKLDKGRDLIQVFNSSEFNNEELSGIMPAPEDKLIITAKSGNIYEGSPKTGIIKLLANVFENLPKDQVISAIPYNEDMLFLGTLSSKIIVINNKGKILKTPAVFQNLRDAVIQQLFKTKNNNVWVMQNNGLAFIDFKSPYTYLFNKASVYDALIHKGIYYLATNQGVYYSANSSSSMAPEFKKVPNLHGQAWSLQLLEGDIIAAHDNGLFKIEKEQAAKIDNISGFWKVTPIKNRAGHYLASHYNGIYLLEKKNGKWTLLNKIAGFDESSRDIMASDEPDTYWVCHGYKGVFRIRINPSYTRVSSVDHFTNKNGLSSSFNVNVARWNGEVVFTTNTGIYTYNTAKNRFIPHKRLNAVLDSTKNTRKLVEYGNKTWFVQDDEAGYFFTNEQKPSLHKDLFLNLKGTFNRGMECIVSLDVNSILFGTTTGLYRYNIKNNSNSEGIQTTITQILYSKDQKPELLPLTTGDSEPVTLPNQTDILRFEFASPKMTHGTEVQYSYMLENIDKNWSAWQNIAYKEYTHLRPGNYTFKVKSRNTAGLTGAEAVYNFTILPKWYQTTMAYALYIIAALILLYLLIRYISNRIDKEHQKTKEEAQRTKKLLELELEQLKLQRDKEKITLDKIHLEEDVINKSKELANYTMLLAGKKDIFAEITDDLKQLKESVKNEESRKKILEMFQKLNRHKIGEEYMEVFDVNFEKVHHNFFEKLKEINPTLTKRELRLCAFVKMDLTNKEISPLLNISLRGVENARYRVRKKLNANHEDNFVSFLEGIAKEAEHPLEQE